MREVPARRSWISTWFREVVGGALAALFGAYLVFIFPPTKLAESLSSTDREPVNSGMSAPEEDFLDNHTFNVLIQYYPSTSALAATAKATLGQAGFSVIHFKQLKEGALRPRQSEIIYYSLETQVKAEEIRRLFASDLRLNLPTAKSLYYGDSESHYKIFINILPGMLPAIGESDKTVLQGWAYLGTFEEGIWEEQMVTVSRQLPRAGDWLRVSTGRLNIRENRPGFPLYRLGAVVGHVNKGRLVQLIEIVPDVGENRVWALIRAYT